jgi:Protein of unknown function (DUF2281)
MTTVEQIHAQVQTLSESLQQEVLDFIEYLRLKQAKQQRSSQQDAAWAQEMQELLTEFRQQAASYTDAEIDQMIDEAVAVVHAGNSGQSNA